LKASKAAELGVTQGVPGLALFMCSATFSFPNTTEAAVHP
jgi:hypothetical protein